MKTSNKKKTLVVVISVIITVIIALVLGLFILLKNEENSSADVERGKRHKVSQNGAEIYAFNSVPKEIIGALKEYIKTNGYDWEDFSFSFQNSKYTSLYSYPDFLNDYLQQNENAPFVYYVVQSKVNEGKIDYQYNRHYIFIGSLLIDESGNVVATQNLMNTYELSKFQTEPDISFTEADDIAREYLNVDTTASRDIWAWAFWNPKNNDEWVLCFKIKFKDNDRIVYIDGYTGEIIE